MYTVTLMGRPNVGKSTLFNRLVGRRMAIVTRVPGTTRDRREGTCEWSGVAFRLIDTGGLFADETEMFAAAIQRQCKAALAVSHRVWVMVDGRAGVTSADEELIAWVRRRHARFWILVNKIDTPRWVNLAADFHRFGAEQVFPISAETGFGLTELLDAVRAEVRAGQSDTADRGAAAETPPQIAIVGRPNVGKSSLANRLLGEERVIVSEIPGTTRDVVDVEFTWSGQVWRLLDTAGHKKRTRARDWPERVALIMTRRTLERADIVWLVLDATRDVARRDKQLAGWAREQGRALVLVVNKWDLVDADPRHDRLRVVENAFRFVAYAPIVPVSARTGEGLGRIMVVTRQVWDRYRQRIATATLNRFLDQAFERTVGWSRGRPVKIKYMTQIGIRPPTFVLFLNRTGTISAEILHRVEKELRQHFDFRGTPIRIRTALQQRKSVTYSG